MVHVCVDGRMCVALRRWQPALREVAIRQHGTNIPHWPTTHVCGERVSVRGTSRCHDAQRPACWNII